jgi:two-component system response regulator AtoC
MLDQGLGGAAHPGDTLSIKKASRRLEKELIQKALQLTGGNRSQAAKILEVSRPMLLAKIKAYHLEK